MVPSISPEMFAGTPMEDAYKRVAPDPDAFTTLVSKLPQVRQRAIRHPCFNETGLGSIPGNGNRAVCQATARAALTRRARRW